MLDIGPAEVMLRAGLGIIILSLHATALRWCLGRISHMRDTGAVIETSGLNQLGVTLPAVLASITQMVVWPQFRAIPNAKFAILSGIAASGLMAVMSLLIGGLAPIAPRIFSAQTAAVTLDVITLFRDMGLRSSILNLLPLPPLMLGAAVPSGLLPVSPSVIGWGIAAIACTLQFIDLGIVGSF